MKILSLLLVSLPLPLPAQNIRSNTDGGADRPNAIADWRVSNPSPDRWFNPCTLLANGTRRNCQANDTPPGRSKPSTPSATLAAPPCAVPRLSTSTPASSAK